MLTKSQKTHETFIHEIERIAISQMKVEDQRRYLDEVKLVYGIGEAGLRGVTYYKGWSNGGGPENPTTLIEVCAFGESNDVQLAGTTIHEIGHWLAGVGTGHGPEWKKACAGLGLRNIKAAGTHYQWINFDPKVRARIVALKAPSDGRPMSAHNGLAGLFGLLAGLKPCSQGVGVRGGKSRGKGSGSRLRKFECACTPPVIVRASRDELEATCNLCGTGFERAEPK